jgi:putative nucleotidyltransferase with HDIG domain
MDLDLFIDRAKHLPPAPTLLPQLLALIDQPDVDNDHLVRLITYDPTLTANVLRLCNSAALGLVAPVASLEEAVLRLGFGQIFRLVVASCGVSSMSADGGGHEIIQRELWSHSVVSAVGAQRIARDKDLDQNVAFTAALLHDIGKIIMWDVLGDRYGRLLEEVRLNQYSLVEAEKRVFGLEHAELGGKLLARWRFPLSLVAAVCFHYNPLAAGLHKELAACVYFGNSIADRTGHAATGASPVRLRSSKEVLRILGLEPDADAKYAMRVREDFASVRALIQIQERS